MVIQISDVQREILRVLEKHNATYAYPLSSEEISRAINVTPSYVREQAQEMQDRGLIKARRGPGGGYYLNTREDENNEFGESN